MKRHFFLLVLLTLVFAASACKRLPVDPVDHNDSTVTVHHLTGTSWQLFGHQDIRSMAPAPVPVYEPIILNFKEKHLADGRTLANQYSVKWKADDKNITFTDLVSTKRWVSDTSYENEYYRILRGALTYSLLDNGRTLIISDAQESLYFHATRSTPPDVKNVVQFADFPVVRFQIDPFHFQNVRLADETHIAFMVQYGGGCAEHDFTLFADNHFESREQTDLAQMMLTHNSNQDDCKAMVTKELVFDIAPLLKKWRETGRNSRLALQFSQAPYLSTIIEFHK